jgi:nitroreductase
MMDILKNRRSVRQFTGEKISNEKLQTLEQALLLAPTSRNLEPWEFIIVRDKNKLKELSLLKPHSAAFLKDCDAAFVICGNTEISDVCIEDCSIASIILQLTAESIGLGSCWAQVRLRKYDDKTTSEEYVRSVMKLPSKYTVVSVIGVGYPASKGAPKELKDLSYEKLHAEKL